MKIPSPVLLYAALGLHGILTLAVMPPAVLFSREPMLQGDYPVHTHRVQVYRDALRECGVPWGCDPAVGAGRIVDPFGDIGAKFMQIAGVVLWFLSEPTVIRLFAFLAMACFPLGVYAACRLLRMSAAATTGSVVSLLLLVWTNPNIVRAFQWGFTSFTFASALAPWILAVLLWYEAAPTRKHAILLLAALLLFLATHVLAPLVIAAPFGLILLRGGTPARRARLVALGAFLLALLVHSFWLGPFVLGFPGEGHGAALAGTPGVDTDLTFSSVVELKPCRIARASTFLVRTLVPLFSIPFALKILGRSAGSVVAVATLANLLITIFGSFVPVLRMVQPLRFGLPWTTLISLSLGCLCAWGATPAARPWRWPALAVLGGLLLSCADFSRPRPAEADERQTITGADAQAPITFAAPRAIDRFESAGRLAAFIGTNTVRGARILVQTRFKAETLVYARWWEREVIGSTYPEQGSPLQFDKTHMLGRPIGAWEASALIPALTSWGIDAVVAWTPEATALFESTLGPGRQVGIYRVFPVRPQASRLLKGSGNVRATVNRLDLADVKTEDGMIVLRYLYHPAWRAVPEAEVIPYRVPEAGRDFIAVRNPPARFSMRFEPWRAVAGKK